jgi:[acyl-carrier-protein] S-malonyltransferase
MQPAAEGLQKILSAVDVKPFSVGVITNVDADVNLDVDRVKSLLSEQAVRPVRWEESVKKLAELGCTRALEIGPGKVLKGLMKRIAPAIETDNFEVPQDLVRLAA